MIICPKFVGKNSEKNDTEYVAVHRGGGCHIMIVGLPYYDGPTNGNPTNDS